MGDAGVEALALALQRSYQSAGGGPRSLAECHLPTTGMGPRGAAALADFLTAAGSANSLRVLNLYGNELGDEGAASLARLFAKNNAAGIPLMTLGLGVNNIGPRGAAALAATLGECPSCPLKTLGLYRNNVQDEGAAALAGMVAKNKIPLSALFLGGNSVQNEGATRLAEALGTNNQLKVGKQEKEGSWQVVLKLRSHVSFSPPALRCSRSRAAPLAMPGPRPLPAPWQARRP